MSLSLGKCVQCCSLLFGGSLKSATLFRHLSSLPLHDPTSGNDVPAVQTTTAETAEQSSPLAHPDYFGVKNLVSMEDLLKARIHLGHKTGMWHPLMKRFIYGSCAGTHILNLDHTLPLLHTALNITSHIAYRGGIIMFVNERPQFEALVQHTARDCGEYYVTQRWRGGTLTNSYMLLGTLRLPDLIIFTSVPASKTAVKEAAKACVPSVGVVDSDCDPSLVMYPIPGNDDSLSALRLYCKLFSKAILLAKEKKKSDGTGDKVNSDLETDPV